MSTIPGANVLHLPISVDAYRDAPDPATAARVDGLITDSRRRALRAERFRRRSSRVLLALAARSRRIERVTAATLRATRRGGLVGASTPVILIVLAVLRALGYVP